MSSWTFETYEQDNIVATYRWNKGDAYELIVGTKRNGLVYSDIYHNTYATKEGAKRAYQRYVRKIKKGEY